MGVLLHLLLLACLGRAGWSQDLRYLRHQSWSTEDGLPQNSVHQVLQASDGFIWVATEGGVARFDGVSFKAFNHVTDPAFLSDDACCLANDRLGNLWVGTADGLLRLREDRFERIAWKDGRSSVSVRGLVDQPDGSLLVLTGGGLAEWRNGRLQTLSNTAQDISGIAAAGDRGAWILRDGQASLWKDGSATVRPSEFGGTRRIDGIAGDGSLAQGHAIWTFSSTAVWMTKDGASRAWKLGTELPGSRIETLFIDRQGSAWIGTNDGLAVLKDGDPGSQAILSLRGNTVMQTMQDREGNYWIATDTSGLHLLRTSKFRAEPALAEKPLTAIVQASDGAIWLGSRTDGLRRIKDGRLAAPVPADKLTSSVILSLSPGTQGSLWVGTPDGLNLVRSDGTVRQITSADGLPDDYIQTLLSDPDGSLWIGTRHGLVRLQGSSMKIVTKSEGLSGDLVGALLLGRQNELWIGTSGGLCRRNVDGTITRFDGPNGLPHGIVTAMTLDQQGVLWIFSDDGQMSRLNAGRLEAVHGLTFHAHVRGVAADARGFLWVRDDQGMVRIATRDLNRCSEQVACSPQVSRYGMADGMPSEETVAGGSPVLWRMTTGEVWSVTRRGVAIVNPERLPQNSSPPTIALERFLVDDAVVQTDQSTLDIAPGHVRYTMDYAALSFTAPTEIRYRFRLEGLDHFWTEAGSRRSATYTNLPSGTYRFSVQAMNNDGVWSEAQGELRFRVLSPFYKRWWFVFLVLACLAGSAILLYKLRLMRLRRQFDAVLAERNRMAREIHDTLAQDFVGVSLQLDIVSQLLGMQKVDAALRQVRETRALVTDGLADARRSIWELRANVTGDSLPSRLGQVVKRYAGGSLTVRLKIGGAFRSLADRVEGEVLRIAQESLSNVQRHAHASEVSVELRYEDAMLVLTIDDNGSGFAVEQAASSQGHYGLRGMQERALVLGGSLEIASEAGSGTKIVLMTPIPGMRG